MLGETTIYQPTCTASGALPSAFGNFVFAEGTVPHRLTREDVTARWRMRTASTIGKEGLHPDTYRQRGIQGGHDLPTHSVAPSM